MSEGLVNREIQEQVGDKSGSTPTSTPNLGSLDDTNLSKRRASLRQAQGLLACNRGRSDDLSERTNADSAHNWN